MKKTITEQLRNLGLTNKQIKFVNNNLRYRGMCFNRITRVVYRYVTQWDNFVFDFIDENNGEICEIDARAVFCK